MQAGECSRVCYATAHQWQYVLLGAMYHAHVCRQTNMVHSCQEDGAWGKLIGWHDKPRRARQMRVVLEVGVSSAVHGRAFLCAVPTL